MPRWIVLGLLATAACSGSDKDTTTDSGVGDDDDDVVGCELVFTDANNYGFESDLQISAVEVMPESELTIDWSGVTTDIRGRAVDPTAVEQLLLVELERTQSEVLADIDANDLQQSDAVNQYLYFNGGVDTIQVTDMEILGNPMDVGLLEVDPDSTWLLSLTNITDARFDFLVNTFVVPTAGSTNTTVEMTDSSATLTFDADLQSATKLKAEAGATGCSLDWDAATTDVFGRELDLGLVTRLIIGKVGTEDLSQVEADFLQLYELSDELYTLDVNGLTYAELDGAVEQTSGETFGGFTSDGTWIVGIECTRQECTNPAPLLLAVVDVP